MRWHDNLVWEDCQNGKERKAVQFVKVVKFSGTTREKNNLGCAARQGYK